MASKELVRLAKAAARASAKARVANRAWVEAFEAEFGHDNISDALIDAIDYSTGDMSLITAKFIDQNGSTE